MGVGGSCRDTGSVWDLRFSVDQLAPDSVEAILYSVGSRSQWDWRVVNVNVNVNVIVVLNANVLRLDEDRRQSRSGISFWT